MGMCGQSGRRPCHHQNSLKRRYINMNIVKKPNGNELTIALEGRLDTTTSPQLENELRTALNGV